MTDLRSVHDGGRLTHVRAAIKGRRWEDSPMPPTAEGFPRISEKLTWIINTIPTADGRRMTPERLARAIIDQTNGQFQVTAGHLQALKTGVRDNPSGRLLLEISRAAGLPTAFFWSDPAETIIRQVVELAQEDHGNVLAPYDALLADAAPSLNAEEVADLRAVVLVLLGGSSSNDEPTP